MSFSKFNLDNRIITNLNDKNITMPTLIQQQVIPLVLQGNDVLAKAPTGTGKTAAFAVPIVENMINNTSYDPTVLVISPTRELSNQITDTFKFLTKKFDYKIISIIGGESIKLQSKKIDNGMDIVVSTPGRLVDLIKRNKINLDSVKYFVLDEVDLMLDMGFIRDMKFIKSKLTNIQLQTVLVSATIPDEVRELSRLFLKDNYAYVETERLQINKNNIKHNVCYLLQKDKPKLLIELIENNPDNTFIVFINTKKVSNYISRCLYEANIKSQIIHGDKSQKFREKAIRSFKQNRVKVLIATDVASRGIHIENVNFVINYDVPNNKDTYTHRVGRTGRAHKKGEAFTFVTEDDLYFLKEVYYSNKNINVFIDSTYCINLEWNDVKRARPVSTRKRKIKDNSSPKDYYNNKNYETKNDLRRKKGIEEYNERVKLNKNVKNFTWGNNNQKFDSSNSKNFSKQNNSRHYNNIKKHFSKNKHSNIKHN
ncbi:DEAD/DEAH box helicase [Malacoplasma muris]|uniref:DEAD/DEAH box helicase n=1 Tax=Malacoplasma muris TaxID=2119 RepID=UPI00398F2AA8